MNLIPMDILGNMYFWDYNNAPEEYKVYMFPNSWIMFISNKIVSNVISVEGGYLVVLKTDERSEVKWTIG